MRPRRSRAGGAAVAMAALAVAASSDAGRPAAADPCRVAQVDVQVMSGSRLLEAPNERLELLAGRALACDDATAQRVLTAIAAAIERLPEARPVTPLRVHLDPRLPPRQAPLTGVEVHVSRREVLVASSALDALDGHDALGAQVWQHEIVHALAAAPPDVSIELRRLWLTLEEALVAHVARTRSPQELHTTVTDGGSHGPSERLSADPDAVADTPWQRALPLPALLASAAYDPHPLAAGLARQLGRGAVVPVEAWLRCLSAPSAVLPAEATPQDLFRAFAARCTGGASREVSAAIERWWGPPVKQPTQSAGARPG